MSDTGNKDEISVKDTMLAVMDRIIKDAFNGTMYDELGLPDGIPVSERISFYRGVAYGMMMSKELVHSVPIEATVSRADIEQRMLARMGNKNG